MEPPISVPQPISDPPRASIVASPPEEPPGVSAGSSGCVVRPQRGLSVSHHYRCQQMMLYTSFEAGPTYHNALREVCLCDNDCSQFFQPRYQRSIRQCWCESPSNISKCRIKPSDIKLILYCYRHAMQGTYQTAVFSLEVIEVFCLRDGIVEADLCQAICLSSSAMCSLYERLTMRCNGYLAMCFI